MLIDVCLKSVSKMNYNSFALLVLILFESTLAIDNNTDYCGYELLTNLDGRAYTIEHVGEEAANKSLDLFWDRMMLNHNVKHFKSVYGHELVDVLESVQWYYNFDAVGHIQRSSTLPVSFRCIYGDAWDLPANQTSATEMDFITTKFYSFEFFDRLESRIPSNVPLPIFNVNGSPNIEIWSNFAKAAYNETEYFIIMLYVVDDVRQFLVIQMKDKKDKMPILM